MATKTIKKMVGVFIIAGMMVDEGALRLIFLFVDGGERFLLSGLLLLMKVEGQERKFVWWGWGAIALI